MAQGGLSAAARSGDDTSSRVAGDWPATLSAIGTMAAVQGVTVSADLPGIVDRIAFESGKAVREGDVLVQLDTRQEQAQLAAVEAQRDLARLNFDRMQGLVERAAPSRGRSSTGRRPSRSRPRRGSARSAPPSTARRFARRSRASSASARSTSASTCRPAIRSCRCSRCIRSTSNFGVPQQDAGQMRVGREVRITADELGGARVHRPRHRHRLGRRSRRRATCRCRPRSPIPRGALRPGMFVQTEVAARREPARSIALPASAISYAPLRRLGVRRDGPQGRGRARPTAACASSSSSSGGARGDQVAVVSGVKPGDEVVTSGVFKLRNGAAVLVNNKVQPANNPAPKPEDS